MPHFSDPAAFSERIHRGGLELHIGRRSLAASFLAALIGSVSLAGVFAAPAGAQVYPPNSCSLALSVSVTIAVLFT